MIEHQFYNIHLAKNKITEIKILPEKISTKKFLKSSITNKLPKIYIIKHKSEIIYVGITTQSIVNRLRYGFTANGKNGYHGYKWKSLDEIDLLVYLFANSSEKIEAIEAEIVYHVRSKTGFWPKYQTEIHFHNATQKEKDVAHEIYKEALKI